MSEINYQLTISNIDEYIRHLEKVGLATLTCRDYRRVLLRLYDSLPEKKTVDQETMACWKKELKKQGYSWESMRRETSIVNGYLRYLNLPNGDYSLEKAQGEPEVPQPELTRAEYLRLLQTARHLRKRNLYLIIKILGCMKIKVQELEYVTVESVFKGYIVLHKGKKRCLLRFPNTLLTDLKEYIIEEKFTEGPLFRTRNGSPIDRTNIWRWIQVLCRDAHVPEEKGNPACLMRLYKSTYGGIVSHAQFWIDQAYDRMLEEEQLVAGWEAD